jgi:hypothetical protein
MKRHQTLRFCYGADLPFWAWSPSARPSRPPGGANDLLAGIAARTAVFSAALQGQRLLIVTASGAALVVLVVLTVLSVYKPRGMTRYGARTQYQQRSLPQP